MTLLTPILICLAVAMILGILWLLAPQAALQASVSVGVIAAHVQITATDRLFVVTRKAH